MHLATYLGLLRTGEETLAASFRQVADGHADEADVRLMLPVLAEWCDRHVEALAPLVERYGSHPEGEPERLHAVGLEEVRSGGLGLLRDLHELYVLAHYVDIAWTLVGQAARGARDEEAVRVVGQCEQETTQQVDFLRTRMSQAAPQALLVAQ
jgi:hypothetical protein